MKKLVNFFVVALVAIVGIFSTSCSSSDDEELKPFSNAVDITSFVAALDERKAAGDEYYLIDMRGESAYDAGHAVYDGVAAINLEATAKNTLSNDSEWSQNIKSLTGNDKSTYIFLYGTGSTTEWTYAGRVATLGWATAHVYLLNGGFAAWQKAGNDVE